MPINEMAERLPSGGECIHIEDIFENICVLHQNPDGVRTLITSFVAGFCQYNAKWGIIYRYKYNILHENLSID